MFTPTPNAPTVVRALASDTDVAWELVELELIEGQNGRATVAWYAAEHPLRMEWRVGKRAFRSLALAREYARTITGAL